MKNKKRLLYRAFGANTMGVVDYFDTEFAGVRWGNDEVACDVAIEDIIMMQNTGLMDRTGADIWEGDVLSIFQDTQRSPVVWKDGGFEIMLQRAGFTNVTYDFLCNHLAVVEVIGNVYQHPELLK